MNLEFQIYNDEVYNLMNSKTLSDSILKFLFKIFYDKDVINKQP